MTIEKSCARAVIPGAMDRRGEHSARPVYAFDSYFNAAVPLKLEPWRPTMLLLP